MKTRRNILIAFILNLGFSIFEFVGGIFTGSVAVVSDALHDMADAAGIGVSWFLEKKSSGQPDEKYTYGYGRYSVLGSAITMLILLAGSLAVIVSSAMRLVNPMPINYDGMIVFAVVGVAVNFAAAFVTREGDSLNQKAVNLHMLEDVLGWAVVLVGAVVMRFTDLSVIDPIMSLAVAVFILINACKGLKEAADIFLEKAPRGIEPAQIASCLRRIDGVVDVHHIHIWSLDGHKSLATMHVVAKGELCGIKEAVRAQLHDLGIDHVTLELETEHAHCKEKHCHIGHGEASGHHHHHHHHHH